MSSVARKSNPVYVRVIKSIGFKLLLNALYNEDHYLNVTCLINYSKQNFINKDFLKQVHRKIDAIKNCTFQPLLVVILNSKYANILVYTKKQSLSLKKCYK